MAKKMLSNAQIDQLKGLGIDVSKVDWNRALQLFMLLVQLFAGPNAPQAKACMAACPDDCCDKLQCHIDVVHSAAKTLGEAIECYEACCKECEPK